jgi:long-chain fatty acid transport protein
MFRFKLISVLAFIAVATSAFAITDEEIFRSFAFNFLNPGARSTAMGGAFIALADDATAAEANPAGLTILTRPEVSFEYRHTETNADELNSANITGVPGLDLIVLTTNTIDDQDQPSYVSVVFPAGSWTFGFSRQEFVKTDAVVNEFINTQLGLGGGASLNAIITANGNVEQDIVNWNFAAGVKLSESFSLGATIRYATLDWNTDVVNRFTIPDFGIVDAIGSHTAIDDNDNSWGFNIGGLWKSPHASFGLVYKRNPKFEVTEVEDGSLIPGQSRSFQNVLKVPDNFGGGVAVKPNDNLTVTADVVYIKFDQLTEDFEAGHSVFTLGYTNDNLKFKVDNGIDYKIGTEFIVFVGSTPVALRAGYLRKASNSLVLDSFSNLLPGDQVILPVIFGQERDDTNHFTFGNGFVFGQHFQLDWAMDTSNLDDTFVLSSVVRF